MVPVGSLHTGVGLRDKHLRDRYLHASRYPAIRLDVPWAGVRRPPPGGSVVAEADGTLYLHGQARPLRFRYTAREAEGVVSVDGSFRIDIRDFGVEPPSFLGIHVYPQVDAEARFQVTESR
jgi:polyisoprenoid-binding protein YceI